jgi:dextranase
VKISPARAKPGEPVDVTVAYRSMDWDTGKLGPVKPLEGVQVTAAGRTATTDANGKARLTGLPEGIHEVVVSGYSPDGAPAVVRSFGRVTVAGDYADQHRIAAWAADWIRDARASGVLLGEGDRPDAAFNPKAPATRAAFVVSLVRALGLKPAEGSTFRDVSPDAWYAREIEAAAQAGLIAGTAPGRFAPDEALTREQAAQLLTRVLGIRATGTASFADSAQVSAGAMPAVQAVLEQGWMTTQADGTFAPKMTMPREQAAVIAVRVLFREGIGKLGGR